MSSSREKQISEDNVLQQISSKKLMFNLFYLKNKILNDLSFKWWIMNRETKHKGKGRPEYNNCVAGSAVIIFLFFSLQNINAKCQNHFLLPEGTDCLSTGFYALPASRAGSGCSCFLRHKHSEENASHVLGFLARITFHDTRSGTRTHCCSFMGIWCEHLKDLTFPNQPYIW